MHWVDPLGFFIVSPGASIWPEGGIPQTPVGPIADTFRLPKPIRIIIIIGGIILGPLVGPIEGIPGSGGPIAPKPKPPITLPAPPKEQGSGKGDDGKGNDGKGKGDKFGTGEGEAGDGFGTKKK